MTDLANTLNFHLKDILCANFEISGEYKSGEKLAGTQSVQDLHDKDTKKGICAKAPGWILFELNDIWEFEEIEVAGWTGNTSIWPPNSGANAVITTSLDKVAFKNVGTLPSTFAGQVITVKLARTKAKYIKFEAKNLLGLGFLNFKKIYTS